MGKKQDFIKESSSIIEQIENQLAKIMKKKKGEVQDEFEKKVREEEREAKKKIGEIEKEVVEDIETLSRYRSILSEFEASRVNIKNQIKAHLSKAISFQSQIGDIAEQTLKELTKVRELNEELEEIQKKTLMKAGTMTKDLQEKYGILPKVLANTDQEKADFDLEEDLLKLKRIKELLNTEQVQGEKELRQMIEPETEEVPWSEPEPMPEIEEGIKAEQDPVEAIKEEMKRTMTEKASPKREFSPFVEERIEEKPADKKKEEDDKAKSEDRIKEAIMELEKYRKKNEEISYFEKDDKIVLDGEGIITALNSRMDEANKLYTNLSETQSPKEQFFIKQEIIWHQEVLRELMLSYVKMCEKDNCSLPLYTLDLLNVDALKGVIEKINRENWSNKEDFVSFENHIRQLKNSFYARLTYHAEYLESLLKELEKSEAEENS